MPHPTPLPAGTVLVDRFRIGRVLGRGGFGIVYLVDDIARGDQAVLKELAPEGTRRSGTHLELGEDAVRLRQRFLDEARLVAKLNCAGVLPVRSAFADGGTAYFATAHLPLARTLQSILEAEGPLPSAGALDIFYQLLETLEHIHERGYLHRDIKPSNILVDADGRAYLIDFGAAREWFADALHTQTVTYTPGYAPPEQLSDKARRGPATDLYALFATLRHMLTGEPPPSVGERMAADDPPLSLSRPDLDPAVLRALDLGLRLKYGERLQSVAEVREILAGSEDASDSDELEALDELVLRIQRFRFEPRSCPACQEGVLNEPRPLRPNVCPVCHRAVIERRALDERICAACRRGTLHKIATRIPIAICPQCDREKLSVRKRGLLARAWLADCPECGSCFEVAGDGMSLQGEWRSFNDWRRERSATVWECDACHEQYDDLDDGQWRRHRDRRALFPLEWALLAAGLDLHSGNAECPQCNADFLLQETDITPLGGPEDPHGFLREYRGRRLSLESVRWLAVGKESPQAGFVCDRCQTELDRDGAYLVVVSSPNRRLARLAGQARKLEDWHRISQGLPEVADEPGTIERLQAAVRQAYVEGRTGFGGDPAIAWKGAAERLGTGETAVLTIGADEITFGGLLRKWRVPLSALLECGADRDDLILGISGEREPVRFRLAPMEMVVHLRSGNHGVVLDAADLCARLCGP